MERQLKKAYGRINLFLFGLLALFSYEIAEISINSFFINYVVDDGWMNARDVGSSAFIRWARVIYVRTFCR